MLRALGLDHHAEGQPVGTPKDGGGQRVGPAEHLPQRIPAGADAVGGFHVMGKTDSQALLRQGLGQAGDAGAGVVIILADAGHHAAATMSEVQQMAPGAPRGCRIVEANTGPLAKQAEGPRASTGLTNALSARLSRAGTRLAPP
jgi:hypothetical protein